MTENRAVFTPIPSGYQRESRYLPQLPQTHTSIALR